jgi:hypothetical protein
MGTQGTIRAMLMRVGTVVFNEPVTLLATAT